MSLTDRKVDLIQEGFDCALRIGHLKDSTLIAKPVTNIRLALVASSAYWNLQGRPATPDDLIAEHYLAYEHMIYNPTNKLHQALSRHPERIRTRSNNGDVLTQMAVDGAGYTLQPTFITGPALQSGKLEAALPHYAPSPMKLSVVYPHRQWQASKLSAFVQFVSEFYDDSPYWDQTS